jgi:hypothetical protein
LTAAAKTFDWRRQLRRWSGVELYRGLISEQPLQGLAEPAVAFEPRLIVVREPCVSAINAAMMWKYRT